MQNVVTYKFTEEGYENLKKEKARLIARRPQVVINLSNAREQGDLSENAGYHAAKDELSQIDGRVRELDVLLRLGKIVEANQLSTVTFGSKVTVTDGNTQNVFTIVNALEADPNLGKMSDESPIGSALLGKKVGDSVDVSVPSGKVLYKIISISK